MKRILTLNFVRVLAAAALTLSATVAPGLSRAPTEPLDVRIDKAKMVFVGKLVNKVEKGDWIHAELIVEEALKGADTKDPVLITWKKLIWNNQLIFDAKEGARGVAILSDKHEGRFWFRDDKFEDLKQLDEVKKILKEASDSASEAP